MNKKYLYLVSAVTICLGGISLPSSADSAINYNKMVTQKISIRNQLDIISGLGQFSRMHGVKIITTKPQYKSENKAIILSDIELKEILYRAGFRGNALKTAWAVAIKESTARPYAYNASSNCYGLFQINMSGSMGPNRREKFGLDNNNDLFDPLTNAKIAYHMSSKGTDWSAWSTERSAKKLANSLNW